MNKNHNLQNVRFSRLSNFSFYTSVLFVCFFLFLGTTYSIMTIFKSPDIIAIFHFLAYTSPECFKVKLYTVNIE